MRLIDADALQYSDARDMLPTGQYITREEIDSLPTVDAEPTEEQVKEYCRKRCLVVVDSALFNEMKAWTPQRRKVLTKR